MIAKIKRISYDAVVFDSKKIFLNNLEFMAFLDLFKRYEKNEPISKIINSKSFWNNDFFVNSNVLDPRPETELIIEMVLSCFSEQSSLNIIDIGTGSGCILLSLLSEYKNSRGLGIDISQSAIEIAKYNQKRLKIHNAHFIVTDWNDFNIDTKFDVIVSNPPYIRSEDISLLNENVKNYDPLLALNGGATGLDSYIAISQIAKKLLVLNGKIFFEVGYDQAKSVTRILQDNAFEIHKIVKDINGIDRVVSAVRKF